MELSLKNVGVESECGKLDIVIMHRPGDELLRLNNDNIETLLFDNIPNLNESQQSHDIFTKYLRDNGTHVLYIRELLEETLVSSKQACQTLIDGIVAHSSLNYSYQSSQAKLFLYQWLYERTPVQLVDDIIRGVTCSLNQLGISKSAKTLLKICDKSINEFIIPPLPNLLFTRDAFSIIEKNVFIWKMAKHARQNEPLIYRVIFKYHPYLSISDLNLIEWENQCYNDEKVSAEGGDIAYLGNGILLIGCSERTNRAGIESIALTDIFQRIIVVTLPAQREFMHLDTIISSINPHAFTLHSALNNSMQVFTVEIKDKNNKFVEKPKWISHGFDVRQSLRYLLNKPDLIFYDALDKITSVKEQRDCCLNVLSIDEYHIVTYADGDSNRGIVAAIKHNDTTCKIGLIPTKGLLEGGGGTHCMTNALRRHRSLKY
ncbi:unnamed protein product [Rotaria sp. Silwood2]|nr:unnamed protein product [Rotaria sp. Silwood2]CAF3123160.1 unnamed protein product [Rotaria sp. Silwood2]CAF3476422.1 unnamed protein product [Rotaria sp. Silwood2]CAF4402252.1 unnamed protein product [Rotaria sp. Silwood2]CAF4439204.1 unnamed protein product [Rotaria sp. Silwood2]